MRYLLVLMFMTMSMLAASQDSINIRISSKQQFPQLGVDAKGRKYFVMSTRQDKAALIALNKGLYMDSILTHYEAMEKNCNEQIFQLNGRLTDKDAIIRSHKETISLLNEDNADLVEVNKNLEKNIEDLKRHVKKQKLPMWVGISLGVLGGVIILDSLND